MSHYLFICFLFKNNFKQSKISNISFIMLREVTVIFGYSYGHSYGRVG